MTDPIAQLCDDLRVHGKPSLAWVTQWAPDGEHIDAAWRVSKAGLVMHMMLEERGWKPRTVCDEIAVEAIRKTCNEIGSAMMFETAHALVAIAKGERTIADAHMDASSRVGALIETAFAQLADLLRDETPPTLAELMEGR